MRRANGRPPMDSARRTHDEGEDDRRSRTDDRPRDEFEDDEVFAVCLANPVAELRDRVGFGNRSD